MTHRSARAILFDFLSVSCVAGVVVIGAYAGVRLHNLTTPDSAWLDEFTVYVEPHETGEDPRVIASRNVKRNIRDGRWYGEILGAGDQAECVGSGNAQYLADETRQKTFRLSEYISPDCIGLAPGAYPIVVTVSWTDRFGVNRSVTSFPSIVTVLPSTKNP